MIAQAQPEPDDASLQNALRALMASQPRTLVRQLSAISISSSIASPERVRDAYDASEISPNAVASCVQVPRY